MHKLLRPRLGSGILSLCILLAKINHKAGPNSREGTVLSLKEGGEKSHCKECEYGEGRDLEPHRGCNNSQDQSWSGQPSVPFASLLPAPAAAGRLEDGRQ